MSSTTAIPFDALANLFVAEGVMTSPAELHGFLCGWVSTNNEGDSVTAVVDALEPELGADKLKGVVKAMTDLLRDQLSDLNFEWQLLLPDDDAELGVRVSGIADWCQGYSLSIALAGEEVVKSLSKDSQEGLGDVSEIGQIQLGEDMTNAEGDLVELGEFVRVVAMNIFLEINQPAPQPPEQDRLH